MKIKDEENVLKQFRKVYCKFTTNEAHNITGLDTFEERTHEPKQIIIARYLDLGLDALLEISNFFTQCCKPP